MNYCPHCNMNYTQTTAAHVCSNNTSDELAGLRERVAELGAELAEARKVLEVANQYIEAARKFLEGTK